MRDTLLDDAAKLLPEVGQRRILGLAGPPGAGKTRLAHQLVTGLDVRMGVGTAAYVPLDGFHLSNAQLERLGYLDRKGAPFTFDVAGYVALLRRLLTAEEAVFVPDYDRALHEPIAARHVVPVEARLVVTEGNYLASAQDGWGAVADLVTRLWYVEAPEDVREDRLVARHSAHGRDLATARHRVEHNDRDNARFVALSRTACHKIISSV